jgi:hypothetical protein
MVNVTDRRLRIFFPVNIKILTFLAMRISNLTFFAIVFNNKKHEGIGKFNRDNKKNKLAQNKRQFMIV